MLLPSTCVVDLSGCSLSTTVLENIQRTVNSLGYSGPVIHYSVVEARLPGFGERSIEVLLEDLFQIADRTLSLPNIQTSADQENKLRIWLNRLCDVADYKSGGDVKKNLANNILTYLEMVNNDPSFKEVFYSIIDEAGRTCGDRAALSLMQLGMAHDLSRVGLQDPQSLSNFLIRGVFVLSLLEGVSREKVASLRFVDEIEVYLGYPVMLKESLQIPINTDQMLYPRCSHITPQDLVAAEAFVLRHIHNEEMVHNFLITQDKWKELLLKMYPDEMNEIESQKTSSSERVGSSEEGAQDYLEIEKQFKDSLIELSKRALTHKRKLGEIKES